MTRSRAVWLSVRGLVFGGCLLAGYAASYAATWRLLGPAFERRLSHI